VLTRDEIKAAKARVPEQARRDIEFSHERYHDARCRFQCLQRIVARSVRGAQDRVADRVVRRFLPGSSLSVYVIGAIEFNGYP
jgi:hypothetical protein